jgi:ubiquinone/menaquinone biosynthesis C-methylase UbiE
MDVDFGKTVSDYAEHRAGFPQSFYDRLLTDGLDIEGKALVDLGTGTGTLARGFARRGANVIGIDPSSQMLESARQAAHADASPPSFRSGTAEATGLKTDSIDVVTAGQCWHWFNRPTAAAEAARILRPGGTLIIGYFNWIPLPGNVVAATENLIKKHNSNWTLDGGSGLFPRWLTDLGRARYRNIRTWSYDEWPSYRHAAWCGRVRASAGIAASLAADAVAAFDAEHAAMLGRDFPDDPLSVHHRVFCILATPP